MAYIPVIQRSDFTGVVKIGVNVKDSDLSSYIKDMQELEFFSWCDDIFYSDVINNGSQTNRPELTTLINEYIKPYLVCGAYHSFLLWHGRTPTQLGLRVENSESSSEISDKGRAELMADVQKKKNIYLLKLKQKMYSDSYTYDDITYTFYDDDFKSNPKPTIGIKRVGGPKQRDYFKKHYRCQ